MNENKTTMRKETKQLGNIRAKLQRPLQTENEICAALFAMQDENYRDFHAKLIPNVDKETIIGVRVPHMRAYARTVWKQARHARFWKCSRTNITKKTACTDC